MLACFVASLFALASCGRKGQEGPRLVRQLKIGSDLYAPYFYVDDEGAFAGIDVEIATEACRRMGMQALFRKIVWQNKDTYLRDKTVDCLWGSFSMNGREDEYDWAGPYLTSRQVVVVEEKSDIHQLKDLDGRVIAVQNASKPEALFLSDAIDGVSVKKVYSFSTIANVFAALKKGYVDAGAGHETACRDYLKHISGAYRILDEPLLVADLGVAFPKGSDSSIIQELSAVLRQMKEDGTLRAILEKYDLDVDFALGKETP